LAAKLACLGIFWLSENAIVMVPVTEGMPGRPLPASPNGLILRMAVSVAKGTICVPLVGAIRPDA
jgi:hypothetical protein